MVVKPSYLMLTPQDKDCICRTKKSGEYDLLYCIFGCTGERRKFTFCKCEGCKQKAGHTQECYGVLDIKNEQYKEYISSNNLTGLMDCLSGRLRETTFTYNCLPESSHEADHYKLECRQDRKHDAEYGPPYHITLPKSILRPRKKDSSLWYTPANDANHLGIRDVSSLACNTFFSAPSLPTLRSNYSTPGSTLPILEPIANQSSIARWNTSNIRKGVNQDVLLYVLSVMMVVSLGICLYIKLKRCLLRRCRPELSTVSSTDL